MAMLAFVAGAGSASATGRVALVIGNGAYQAAPVLANPANDATDVAASLQALGFVVLLRTDATRDDMARVIGQFVERARDADLALLFYAGHGVQLKGENYLLPVDVRTDTESAITLNSIDLSKLQEQIIESGPRANIIILDACRNNPFLDLIAAHRGVGVSRGLTPMDAKTVGSLIVFSTQPNSVAADGRGRNSPFTSALLAHMGERGLEIRQMISRVRKDVIAATGGQVPWDNSSLVDDIYLAGLGGGETPITRPTSVPPPPDPCANASDDELAAPVRNLFTAMTRLDLSLYADQWTEDAMYQNARTRGVRDKAGIVAQKQQQFARWSAVRVALSGPFVVSRNARDAVLEDNYTLTILSGGRTLPSDSARERYAVRCDSDGRWLIVRNDDYLP